MDLDQKLFTELECSLANPVLRIYSWKNPTISLGYAQKPEEDLDLGKCKEFGWEVVVRPTGGGLVFHNTEEITYSVVCSQSDLPQGLIPSFKTLSQAVICGLGKVGLQGLSIGKIEQGPQKTDGGSRICFSLPYVYEILANGKKLVGAAQKRGKFALLQQGSIRVKKESNECWSLVKNSQDLDLISEKATDLAELGFNVERKQMEAALVKGFAEHFNLQFEL